MKCEDIEFGTYGCVYNIVLPWLTKDPCNPEHPPEPYIAAIDKCLLPEILYLWEQGIKTTGCCCGHGKKTPYIGVEPKFIEQMISLGYDVQFNPCRPGDNDTFFPKTKLKFGEAKVWRE